MAPFSTADANFGGSQLFPSPTLAVGLSSSDLLRLETRPHSCYPARTRGPGRGRCEMPLCRILNCGQDKLDMYPTYLWPNRFE